MAVGTRVFVNCPGNRSGTVVLGDAGGKLESTVRLADGIEVEVLAWRPRGASDTRYRVRASSTGADGWLPADHLRKSLVPPPPPPPAPGAPPTFGGDDDVRPFGQRSRPENAAIPSAIPAPPTPSAGADPGGRRFGQRS